MDAVILELWKSPCTEENSRDEEKCGHAKCAQMLHAHVDVCKVLFAMVKANEQEDESLVFVNPFDSGLCGWHFSDAADGLEPSAFIFDGGAWTVTWKDDGIAWERQELAFDA